MPLFMTETKFTDESLKALAKRTSDRPEFVGNVIEAYGGKLHSFYWVFGKCDIVMIYDAPDNKTTMAILLSLSAGGAVASHRTTALISNEEAMAAMDLADTKKTGYKSPRKEWEGWLDEGGEG